MAAELSSLLGGQLETSDWPDWQVISLLYRSSWVTSWKMLLKKHELVHFGQVGGLDLNLAVNCAFGWLSYFKPKFPHNYVLPCYHGNCWAWPKHKSKAKGQSITINLVLTTPTQTFIRPVPGHI